MQKQANNTIEVPYKETKRLSALIQDYIDQNQTLLPFCEQFFSIENFEKQIEKKGAFFSNADRSCLWFSLNTQYFIDRSISKKEISGAVKNNIEALRDKNTFTITTGHQLNLFTGPLYFFYKIFSTINLCESLKEKYPEYNFVPVYWMATEDHDFEEINHFTSIGKTLTWHDPSSVKNQRGAVGRLPLGISDKQDLEAINQDLQQLLGNHKNAKELQDLFKKAYLSEDADNLAAATFRLVNLLFGDYGLVVIDADRKHFKERFIPYLKKELSDKYTYSKVQETNSSLKKLGYKTQVNPREINLFYITEGQRNRIEAQGNNFIVSNSSKTWKSLQEIYDEMDSNPERFSPNVLLRPLYQEVLLPNLAYIGGGGELAYWMQLSSTFKKFEVPFPLLGLRDMCLLSELKVSQKLQKWGGNYSDLFLSEFDLRRKYAHKFSSFSLDFSSTRQLLHLEFDKLEVLAKKTDASFEGALKAQRQKQLKGLQVLEKRLEKAQMKQLIQQIDAVVAVQKQLFPNGNLQERSLNFSEFYSCYGKGFLQVLKANLNPLKQHFKVIEL